MIRNHQLVSGLKFKTSQPDSTIGTKPAVLDVEDETSSCLQHSTLT
jgi:hypothetical protein